MHDSLISFLLLLQLWIKTKFPRYLSRALSSTNRLTRRPRQASLLILRSLTPLTFLALLFRTLYHHQWLTQFLHRWFRLYFHWIQMLWMNFCFSFDAILVESWFILVLLIHLFQHNSFLFHDFLMRVFHSEKCVLDSFVFWELVNLYFYFRGASTTVDTVLFFETYESLE